MKQLYYTFYNLFYKPILKLYLKTDSNIRFDGFKLKVFKDVFHPKLFFSTTYFYEFIKKLSLEKIKFLEIGSGSGVLSMLAFKKGALVTAIDIDEKAVENTRFNFQQNFNSSTAVILQSDLFTNLPEQKFNVIVINPPYYFKKVVSSGHYAWYCGENGEYFEKLFLGLANYMDSDAKVYMILEENCEIDRIQNLGSNYNLEFELADSKQIKWEKNYIFRIKRKF